MQIDGFDEASIMLRGGVYILSLRQKIVYVGKSKCFLERVYTHRNAWKSKRRKTPSPAWIDDKGIMFDQFFIQPCSSDRADELEQELIAKYRPKHNVQHNPRDEKGLLITLGIVAPDERKMARRQL